MVGALLAAGATYQGTIAVVEQLKCVTMWQAFLGGRDFLPGRAALSVTCEPDLLSAPDPRPGRRVTSVIHYCPGSHEGDDYPLARDRMTTPETDRRRFFRAFATQILETAATVGRTAGELQRTSR